ncbi:MAG TPA: glycosyltransferase [Candidatus Sulfotelmatobacter sp.]|nr:glycosyltransferase [Candidatus Sulfotelmatobacter sp.]
MVTTRAVGPLRGGSGRRMASLCVALAEQGIDVTVVALGASGTGTRWTRLAHGVRQVVVARSDEHAATDARVAAELGRPCEELVAVDALSLTPRFGAVLRDALRAADVAIVNGPALVESVAASWDGPFVYDAAGASSSDRTTYGRALHALELRGVRRAGLVLAASADEADVLAAHGVVARDAIVVVPILVDPAGFRSVERAPRRLKRQSYARGPVALFYADADAGADVGAAAERLAFAAAALPAVQLIVGGEAARSLAGRGVPAGVTLVDGDDEESYRWMLSTVDVALCPLAGETGTVLDAVAGGAAVVVAPAVLDTLGALRASVEVAAPDGWPAAIERVLAAPDAELEARVHASQRALASVHGRGPIVGALAGCLRELVAVAGPGSRAAVPRVVVAAGADSGRAIARYGARQDALDVVVCSRTDAVQEADELVVSDVLVRRVPPTSVETARGAAGSDVPWLNPAFTDALAHASLGAVLAVSVGPFAHRALRATWPGPLVYDAPQVAYLAALATAAPAASLQRVAESERACARDAAAVLCACEEDAQLLVALYDLDPARVTVVPPGLAGAPPYASRAQREAAKAGSTLAGRTVAVCVLATPGDASALAPLGRIAAQTPHVLFVVVGAAAPAARTALGAELPGNVQFAGNDAATLATVFAIADLAVHPSAAPSGISYAIADYVGAGLPLLCTPRAARGWAIADRLEAEIAEPDELPERLRRVLAEPLEAELGAERLRARLARRAGPLDARAVHGLIGERAMGLVSA